jgi:hypothetical protein
MWQIARLPTCAFQPTHDEVLYVSPISRRKYHMLEWVGLPPAAAWWTVIASAVMFAVGLLVVPLIIIRIPSDYFADEVRTADDAPFRSAWVRWSWLVLKNVLGIGFLFFGLLMLVLPGQGILTILVALTLLDFPGKFRLQRWVVSRRGVLDSINWVRKRHQKEPLALEPLEQSSDVPASGRE